MCCHGGSTLRKMQWLFWIQLKLVFSKINFVYPIFSCQLSAVVLYDFWTLRGVSKNAETPVEKLKLDKHKGPDCVMFQGTK